MTRSFGGGWDLVKVSSERSYPGSTTSFSVADRYGNVVVSTPTLGSLWGTGVVVGSTGIIFNNGTRHGSTSPYPDDVNYARGGQIPVLNNSPIVVMKDGAFYLALGTPGGETIGQTQFQVLLNVLDYGMEIQEAIEAPRISPGRGAQLLPSRVRGYRATRVPNFTRRRHASSRRWGTSSSRCLNTRWAICKVFSPTR